MLKVSFWIALTAMLLSVQAHAKTNAPRAGAKAPSSAAALVKKTAVKPAAMAVALPVADVAGPLSDAQLALANKVIVGKIPCELAANVILTPDPRSAGRFVLELGREKHFMVPVATSTGAVRLEDTVSGAVWLQLSNKSMLVNQKQGRRLADACMNPEQLLVAQAMERNPGPGLLDAPVSASAQAPAQTSGTTVVLTAATN